MCECGNENQTPEHLIYRCNKVDANRRKQLVDTLQDEHISNVYLKKEDSLLKAFANFVRDNFILTVCKGV